ILMNDDQVASGSFIYLKIKEHAKTYPYVWASYIVVYGDFGLWTAYKWRKLLKIEDKVRNLQEKLWKVVETEESDPFTFKNLLICLFS
ncbi:hypothetical protein S245_065597, partial [Arachis hypogaea]